MSDFLDKNKTIKDVEIRYTEIGNGARGESYAKKCEQGEYDHSVSYKQHDAKFGCSNSLCSIRKIDIGAYVHKAINSGKDILNESLGCNAPEKGVRTPGIRKTCDNRIYFELKLVR